MQKPSEETLLTCIDGLPSGQSIEPRGQIETHSACLDSWGLDEARSIQVSVRVG